MEDFKYTGTMSTVGTVGTMGTVGTVCFVGTVGIVGTVAWGTRGGSNVIHITLQD